MKNEILARLDRIEQLLREQKTTLLSFKAASEYLQISRSTLYKLVHFNRLRASKPNGKRLWFSKSDLDNWALQRPSKINSEIEDKAIEYMNRNHGK